MNEILLVRHGQDTDNANSILNGHRDTKLTELGKSQAREVAQKLADDDINYIYHSPLTRAHQTAEIIAKELKIDGITQMEELIERDFGILTGKPVSEIEYYAEETLKGDDILYFLSGEGVEEFPDAYQRACKALRKIEENHSDDTVLFVTHGDIGKMIQAAYHGWSWEEGLKAPYFDNADILHLGSQEDYIE